MPVDAGLRLFDIDLPAQPGALVELSLLMAEPDLDLRAAADLIETDMALAAAVLRAVNSSMYGLKGRVQTVLQAAQYLGLREVAGITYEMGLRAAFPATQELEGLWRRAALRGLVMGRLGQRLGVDGWAAHSAGLFEECGKAVLLRHAPAHYPAMLRAAPADDASLAQLERTGFGVSHDALGAALCASWGLAAAAVDCVRHRIAVQSGAAVPAAAAQPALLVLSALTQALQRGADEAALAALAGRLAPQGPLDEGLLTSAVQAVARQLGAAAAQAAGN